MALTSTPRQARAIAAFNPTAPDIGFLQPLLIGGGGDNRSFVQIFSPLGLVASLAETDWPERDYYAIEEQGVAVGGESLWSFYFPGEAPVTAFWGHSGR